ncbi:alpha/beta hydrolase [Pseudomonas daroniae]|uniref:Alpha/beta hydrolase n=1 Tax=Phytopseudomonas daroniae TaxID=2487519 RepID=A0A4Q9QIM9_9GAMM|nr:MULTISPECIES: alpha/beta hydrolase [Pseudomonas]TBU73503.1 alpha/beta hydrolase [Pseudomonas daroniae]TBU74807.1 alpha/beta hydrolase [Pseudomonas daroniae]TBU79967.1 alpha/beta hydrolase [Pseudomonas sp. FRB 228]TBU88899.1 alpha/beta hydrolase [Pseudomonas daroniae]
MSGLARDRRLNVGKVTLNYRVDGAGTEPLLCIHGVGSSLLAWEGVVQRLKEHFTVLTFDLRGHGDSTRLKGRYEIDEMVDEALALADAVGFLRFHLAGFSLGGLIAQRLALSHPQRVRRLVLLSTVAGRNEDEQARVLARLDALQTGDPGSHYDASLSRWLSEDFQMKNPELVAQLRQRNAQNDPECYAAAYRVLAQNDFGDVIEQIRCPTLIATGADDAGSNPRMASFMHERIRGSRLCILPGLRHSILTEAPELVASMMQGFLLQATTASRDRA